jgi:uncharacterized protein (DUF433 family)
MHKAYVEQRNGTWYVAGSRVSLDSIIYAFHRGESPETICHNFELLTLKDVYGAITWYLGNQLELDAYLKLRHQEWENVRQQSESIPDALRERLLRARQSSPASPTA